MSYSDFIPGEFAEDMRKILNGDPMPMPYELFTDVLEYIHSLEGLRDEYKTGIMRKREVVKKKLEAAYFWLGI